MNKKLPNFLIVGTPKSGSTTLCKVLEQHPDVFMSNPKEPHFFSDGRYLVDHDWNWYHGLFEGATTHKAIGEGTIEYVVKHKRKWADPQLIHNKLPNAKILYIIRHPLDRMLSQYINSKMIGHPTDMGDFEDAVHNHPLLLETCKYWQNIVPYIDLYGSENVKTVFFEDMKSDPANFFKDVFTFLEVDPEFKIEKLPNSNPTIQRPMESALSSKIRALVDIRLLKKIIPKKLVTLVGNQLKSKFHKPEWTYELKTFAYEILKEDMGKILSHCNKPSEFWDFRISK